MLQIPKLGQISNFSATEKRRKFGAVSGVTLNSLQQSVSEFQEVPEDGMKVTFWVLHLAYLLVMRVSLLLFGRRFDYPSMTLGTSYVLIARTGVRGINTQLQLWDFLIKIGLSIPSSLLSHLERQKENSTSFSEHGKIKIHHLVSNTSWLMPQRQSTMLRYMFGTELFVSCAMPTYTWYGIIYTMLPFSQLNIISYDNK